MASDPQLVLATDLDGTFLGGDDRQRSELYADLTRRAPDVILIFVTGRDLQFVRRLAARQDLPAPRFVIGDVGTSVVHGLDHAPVREVEDWVDESWQQAADRVRDLLGDEPGLRLQPVMGGRRVSYFYDPHRLRPGLLPEIRRAGFDVITSAGKFLDVLPRGVAKGSALSRLVDAMSLPRDAVLVAGDTLNDLSLFDAGFRGVVVGNAESGLLRAVEGRANVHSSPYPGCGGISDAIEHFGCFAGPTPA